MLLAALSCLDAARAASKPDFTIHRWTTDDGLPQNRISCLKQTRDGYLWIGTWFGLARFDGVRFTLFDKFNTPELVNDAINALAEDAGGTLWIATSDGLLSYRDHRFHRFTMADGLPDRQVWRLAACRTGGIWLQAGCAVVHLKNGRFSLTWKVQLPPGDVIRSFQEGADGLLHVVSGDDWLTWSSPRDEHATNQFKNSTGAFWLTGVPSHQPGSLWLGTQQGLQRWKQGSFVAFDTGEMGRKPADFIFEDRSGGLWVNAKPGGLFHRDDSLWMAVDLGVRAGNVSTSCVEEDREGNFWLGTDYGLVQLRTRRVRAFTTRDGIADDNIWSVCEGTDGTIWVGGNRELSRIQNGSVAPLKGPEVLSDRPNRCVWPARGGGVLTAKPGIGVFEFGEKLTQLVAVSALPDPNIFALYEDRSGRLWIGTGNGVAALQDGQVTAAYTNWAGRSGYNVRCILEDRSGSFWFGTQGQGLTRLRNGKFEVFNERDGLCNNHVWSIHEDGDGVLWLGTENGLNRFVPPGGKLGVPASAGGASPSATPSSSGEFQPAKAGTPNAGGGRFCSFTRKEGLLENAVNWILEDEFGYLWLSGLRGIYRVKREQLNAVAEGRARAVQVAAFGTADGMESSETNGENQPAGWKARDGRLWFPTTRGVVVIDPKTIEVSEVPPPVVIEQVKADEEVIFGDGAASGNPKSEIRNPKFQLAPGRAQVVEISYTANTFVDSKRARFRYRLMGRDSDWRAETAERVAHYTNLRPGSYRFEVSAANHHGVWSTSPETFAFSLAPHVWQTWPFYVGCGLAVIGAAGGVQAFRLRVQRRILRLEQQHALEQERARIAKDLHDDLGANLTGIALQVDVAQRQIREPVVLEPQLRAIAQSTRALVDQMREVIWAVNPQCDTLESFCSFLGQYAESFLSAAGVRCRLDFPAQLAPLPVAADVRHHLFLVVKEALHNIVKHAAATEAWIRLAVADTRLSLRIEDNGRGLTADHPKSQISKIQNPASAGGGHGLANMRRRVEMLGGRFDLESSPGLGTAILVAVPVVRSRRRIEAG